MPDPITEFSTPNPDPNPAQPDFTTSGMLLNIAAPDTSPLISKSVKVNDRPAAYQKMIYAISDQAGSMAVEIMIDESERTGGGAAVWRLHTTVPIVANTLAKFSTTDLFAQMRVTYTPGAAANVKVWGLSLP